MHQDNCGYLCMIIQPAMKEDAGWYTVSAKNDAGIVSSTARLDIHSKFQLVNSKLSGFTSSPRWNISDRFCSVFSSVAAAQPPQA